MHDCRIVIKKARANTSLVIVMSSLFQTLPVEILHHILDDLDAQTILISFRNTCRRFRNVVNSYDRYVLNFESISKSDFELLCRLIDPRRVTSLTLSENDETLDQIRLFLSHLSLHQFSRLRSLSLFLNEEQQLTTILNCFNIHSLKSFSLKIIKRDDRRKTTTARLLSSVIAKTNLSRLDLQIGEERLEKIIWSSQCMIQCLKIGSVIFFNELYTILDYLPHLRTLILKSFLILNPQQIVVKLSLPTTFRQLTSLTFDKLDIEIDHLGQFLSLTPSLSYLKLIGYKNYGDGNQWEHLIQLHLPLLNKFEFFFSEMQNAQQNPPDIQQIIAPFQTPFWLEHKKWFVTCEVNTGVPTYIRLYSLPICVSFLSYETKTTSISTFPKTNDKNTSIMDNVDTVTLDFTKLIPLNMEHKVDIMN